MALSVVAILASLITSLQNQSVNGLPEVQGGQQSAIVAAPPPYEARQDVFDDLATEVFRVMASPEATPAPTSTLSPRPTLKALSWHLPTATPVAEERLEPGISVDVAAVRGPQVLTLWNGSEVEVKPATRVTEGEGVAWQVPDQTAGWHYDTGDCGRGMTIIAGHVSWQGRRGVFADLPSVSAGDIVTCVDAEGQIHQYEPVDYLLSEEGANIYEWPPEWSTADLGTLLLYTCGKRLDGKIIVVRFREMSA